MKSHVSLEQQVCVVCGHPFDTGAVLLDRRLKASLERNTVTGYGLCPEHQQRHDDGFVALVGADDERSKKQPNGNVLPQDACRTGEIVHLRRAIWEHVFNTPPPVDRKGDPLPVVFCDDAVIAMLKQMASEGEERSE